MGADPAEAAYDAFSKKAFPAKASVALKESSETQYRPELLHEADDIYRKASVKYKQRLHGTDTDPYRRCKNDKNELQ